MSFIHAQLKIWTTICDLVPTPHGQMHRLIPNADAVELAFFFVYLYKQQLLWCIKWHIFTGSHEHLLLNLNQMCLLIW